MRFLTMSSFNAFYCITIMCFTVVTSQRNGEFPLVTVPDVNVTFDSNALKVFSTQLELQFSNATFNQSIFMEAATQYYRSITVLEGFVEITNLQSISTNETAEVSYDVVYNYTALRNSVDDDEPISRNINDVTAIKQGLESDPDFDEIYNVSLNPFFVRGNSLCDGLNCPQGVYTICEETRIGVEVICKSSCKTSFCLNDGWCVHNNGSTAPICSCVSSTSSWFIGTQCEANIHLWMPILFFVVVFLIIVMIILLACCLPVRIRKQKLKKFEQPVKTKPKETRPRRNEGVQPEPASYYPGQNRPIPPIHKNPYHPPAESTDQQSAAVAPSTEYFDPGYSQVIPHQRESVGSDHNSAERVQNDPPENQSGKESPTATEPTTSGEDMASYMLSMTSGSVSEITQIHQELHLENPHYHKGKKNPPVPTQRLYISEELAL